MSNPNVAVPAHAANLPTQLAQYRVLKASRAFYKSFRKPREIPISRMLDVLTEAQQNELQRAYTEANFLMAAMRSERIQ